MRKIITSLTFLVIAAAILLLAALLLIPQQVVQTWQRWQLPPTALEQMQAVLGLTQPADEEIRLYGTVEARAIHAMSEVDGRAREVLVTEGDWVEPGQPLIRLDPTAARAQVAAAEEGLAAAQAAREAATAPPGPEVQQLADSAVTAAQTRLSNAQRSLKQARELRQNPLSLNAQINQTAALIPIAQAQMEAARADIKQAQVLIDDARDDVSMQGQYQVRILEEQKAAGEAALDAATARVQGLQQVLALLKKMRDNPLALEAQVHKAGGAVAVAQAGVKLAQAEQAAQTAPPPPEVEAVAEAGVQQAQTALDLARWQEERLVIVAPAAGQVQARLIEEGERVAPGQPLITLIDASQLEVWVYVPAGDLQRVQLGETLPIEVLALPGQSFQGQVFYIAPQAQFRPANVLNPDDRGDMVFLVKLHVANPEGVLKPGMPADVLLKK